MHVSFPRVRKSSGEGGWLPVVRGRRLFGAHNVLRIPPEVKECATDVDTPFGFVTVVIQPPSMPLA